MKKLIKTYTATSIIVLSFGITIIMIFAKPTPKPVQVKFVPPMVETIDALADILYVVYGAGASFGIDLDKAFDIVHRSNMSKLCQTEEDAIETVRIYKEKYDNGLFEVFSNLSRVTF